jgi:hypothetical protein
MLDVLSYLSIAFFALGFLLWVRVLLHARPAFAEFYARSGSWWEAVWAKFSTVKTKSAAAFVGTASALIELHDFVLPAAGVDWAPLTAKIPPVAWPIVSLGVAALFYWLRKVTAKAQDQAVAAVATSAATAVAAGVPPEEAAVKAAVDAAMMVPAMEKEKTA